MRGTFSQPFEHALGRVRKMARSHGHGYVTLEHIALAVLDEPAAAGLFRQREISLPAFREELLEFIERHVPRAKNARQQLEETRSATRVQARAQMIFEAPTGIHMLEMLFEERHSYAVQLLRRHGIDRDQAAEFRARLDRARFGGPRPGDAGTEEEAAAPARADGALRRCTVNLNERARRGELDGLIGREDELRRIIQTLGRRRKNNVVLVGEPGVGKTALAEGLAWQIARGEAPAALAPAVVLSLSVGELVAGTRFRGDFEERVRHLLRELRGQPHLILFIDEIHMLVGAGSAAGMAMDAADLLKPLLAAGELRCIGATTYREYRQVFERDGALARRFQRVDVAEPSPADAARILAGLRRGYERHHRVAYPDAALQAVVDLSVRHLHGRQLPDKAIDLLDETGSRCRLERGGDGEVEVSVGDVERTVAVMARIPERSVRAAGGRALRDLEQRLRRRVFGQDRAIGQLARAVRTARAGLQPPRRPVGAFLFAGPTGVGKTELCRQLARALGVELLRFDMSEYMERHAVARLLGAPPGYVGYGEGGLLTEAVMKHPCGVLLLDEIEKAHPDIAHVLLQLMDYGRLTDSLGRTVDARNLLLVMTSNAGGEAAGRAGMGFAPPDAAADVGPAVARAFAPEFRNRLDAVVRFEPLDPDSVLAVAGRLLEEVGEALRAQGVELKADLRARRWLAREGYDPALGARPMERVVRARVREPLAEMLLAGELGPGATARLSANRAGLRFRVAAAGRPAAAALH